MDEIKKMLIDWLCEEYTIEEATEQVHSAKIKVTGNSGYIIYDNGTKDYFEIVTVKKIKARQI